MKKYFIYLSFLVFIASCSNEKNTFISRSFHKTTTHYNGFFNAREEMRLADKSLWESHEENWDELLPLFIHGDESVYGNMETAIEKCGRAIEKHSIYIKKKEYNKWIDDTYLLMGKAFLYKKNYAKAEEVLGYVEKQYKKEPIKYNARLWLAVLNAEDDNFIKAASILEKLEEDKADFPKKLEPLFREVYADFYIKKGEYDFAVDELKKAIHITKNKRRRTRQTFLLAQLYDRMGKSSKSIHTFAKVLKLRPDYTMEFYAKINQALAFDRRADGKGVREVLDKLLKEKKYAEFKDQIYYALAQLEFADNNNDVGIEHLIKSTEVSVNNDRQKGKSFLSLSEIYFDQRDYRQASGYYDSTIVYLPADYPDYDVIKRTKENLSELVGHLIIVQEQDSLLTLANLPEKELNKKLRNYIKKKEDEKAELRRLEKEQRENEQARLIDGRGNNRGGGNGGKSGAWYFYNPTTKSSGFAEFKRKYGNRKWGDNWIRKDKTQVFDENEDLASEDEEQEVKDDGDKIPTLEELKSRLPLSDEDAFESNKKISDAMYKIGKLYKENFKDNDNAIESFEEMTLRYPEEKIIPTVYYQLYLLYLKKEEDKNYFAPDLQSTSAYYKELLANDFPNSEFTAILSDPDYQTDNNKRAEETLENYKNTFRQYRRRNYTEVLMTCTEVIKNDPSNRLLAKYHLLKAMVIAQKKDRDNYVKALQEIVQLFPSTEEGDEAERLLGLLGETTNSKPNKPANLMEGLTEQEEKPEEKPQLPKANYNEKLTGSHYYIMAVPKGDYPTEDLKIAFTDYNKESFTSEDLKVTSTFLTKDMKLLLVRTFKDKDSALNYYEATKVNQTLLKDVNTKEFMTFIITSKNFGQLFKAKDLEGYQAFFVEKYLN